MKDVIAIIVTFNRLNMLKRCIYNLSVQNLDCDILVVDNCSTDGTEKYIKSKCNNTDIHYYNTGKNLGGAGGFNIGIRLAAKYNYKFVWLMDDDCIPLENALQKFIEYEDKNTNKYGFLSSKVLWKDNSICKMNIQREEMYSKVSNFESDVVSITMASFVSLFVPMRIIRDVGLPIKEFFIWTDDWEFTRRISRKYKCFLLNNSIVKHYSNDNEGANIVNASIDKLERFNYLYRNDVYLYKREGIRGGLYEIIRLLSHIAKICMHSNNKFKRIKIVLCSSIAGLFFNPAIELLSVDCVDEN